MIRYILAALLFAGPAFGQSATQPPVTGTPGNITSFGANGVAGDSGNKLQTVAPFEIGLGVNALQNDVSITGGNVAIGQYTLQALTTGFWNIGIGTYAGTAITTGQRNVAVGFNSLAHQTTSNGNVAIGDNALSAWNGGGTMTAVGSGALGTIQTGTDNDAFGSMSLGNAVTGATQDTALGEHTMHPCTTCSANTAVGHGSMGGDDTNPQAMTSTLNTYMGNWSAQENTTGSHNVGIGTNNQIAVNVGNYNASLGFDALCGNSGCSQTGGLGTNGASYNTAMGAYSLTQTTGNNNTSFGAYSMQAATSAHDNTAVGYQSLFLCSTCIDNVVFGDQAAYGLLNNFNVVVGYQAGYSMANDIQDVVVGSNAFYSHSGSQNVAIGGNALNGAVGHASNYNVAIGFNAGSENGVIGNNGNNNIYLGPNVGSVTSSTGSNNILIGTSSAVDTVAPATSNEINLGGLLFYNNASVAAPSVSGGTSPTIDARANNRSGTVKVGSGTVTSATITFAGAGYSTWDHCRVTSQSALTSFAYSYTLTAITVTASSLTSATVDYDCDGY